MQNISLHGVWNKERVSHTHTHTYVVPNGQNIANDIQMEQSTNLVSKVNKPSPLSKPFKPLKKKRKGPRLNGSVALLFICTFPGK